MGRSSGCHEVPTVASGQAMLCGQVVRHAGAMPILLKSQPWNRAHDENPEIEIEWNMWQRRLHPWDELAVGRRVILVSGGGPRRGLLTYRVEVPGVVKESYASHEDAWRQLKDGLGEALAPDLLDRDGFLDHEYTVGKPVSGWLLGWTYRIVDEVRLPRPAVRLPRMSSGQVRRHFRTRGECRQGDRVVVCRGGRSAPDRRSARATGVAGGRS